MAIHIDDDGAVFASRGRRAWRVSLEPPTEEWWHMVELMTGHRWSVTEFELVDGGGPAAWRELREGQVPVGAALAPDELEKVFAQIMGRQTAKAVIRRLTTEMN